MPEHSRVTWPTLTKPATRPPTGFRLSSSGLGPVFVSASHAGRSGEGFFLGGDDDCDGGGDDDCDAAAEDVSVSAGRREGAALGGGEGRFFVAAGVASGPAGAATAAGAECLGGDGRTDSTARCLGTRTSTSTGWFPRSACARCLFARASA